MPRVTINGRAIDVPEGTNLVAAAESAGQEIPHYCYHPGLSVAGNCRMCLVEIKALSDKQPNPLPKLQIACNTIVQDGMVIESANERVEEARRGVLEFLLINHPIDCPICDQAGECKLQEYYMDYGSYRSRFALEEKVHKEKATPIGPGVMLDQERCILCTRCIRFLEEVTETNELCVTERGDHSELTLADGKSVDNAYSTNIVDICPVGALTSREFRFQARVWYLEETPSICPGCATGCNVDVHSREDTVFRLKPRANPDVNGFWMCDAGRRTFAPEGDKPRLEEHYTRTDDGFQPAPFDEVVARGAGRLAECGKVALVVSPRLSVEEAYLVSCIGERLSDCDRVLVGAASSDIDDDGLLVSSDRFPNRAGVAAFGFRDEKGLADDIDGALIVRADPAVDEGWGADLEKLRATVALDETMGTTLGYADAIVGVSAHFEADGTAINRTGRLQACRAAVDPPGDARHGWRALATLLVELGGPRYTTIDEVFAAACEAMGLGAGLRRDALGTQGLQLADARTAAATAEGPSETTASG